MSGQEPSRRNEKVPALRALGPALILADGSLDHLNGVEIGIFADHGFRERVNERPNRMAKL